MTHAEKIAAALGEDGTRWETADGRTLEDLCADARTERDEARQLTRYAFADGSAIVAGVSGWDLEGSTPFGWAGA